MSVTRENFFREWVVLGFGGDNPDQMRKKVNLSGHIKIVDTKNGGIKLVTYNGYARRSTDNWHEVRLRESMEGGDVTLIGILTSTVDTINLPLTFRVKLVDDGKDLIECSAAYAPEGNWNGEED